MPVSSRTQGISEPSSKEFKFPTTVIATFGHKEIIKKISRISPLEDYTVMKTQSISSQMENQGQPHMRGGMTFVC